MASEGDGSSRGKKDKNILHIFERKASNLFGRAKEEAEKAIDKVKDTADKAKEAAEKAINKVKDTADKAKEEAGSNAEKVIDKVKDSTDKAKEGIEHIKDNLLNNKHSDHDQPETEKAEEDNNAKAETGENSKLQNVVGRVDSLMAFMQPKKEKVEKGIEAAVAVIQPEKKEDTPTPGKKDSVPSTEEKKHSVPSIEEKKHSVPPPVTDIVPAPATANVPAPAAASAPRAIEKEGFWESIGKWLENCCSIFKSKTD